MFEYYFSVADSVKHIDKKIKSVAVNSYFSRTLPMFNIISNLIEKKNKVIKDWLIFKDFLLSLKPVNRAILIERYKNCLTLAQIAEKYNVSQRTICRRLELMQDKFQRRLYANTEAKVRKSRIHL